MPPRRAAAIKSAATTAASAPKTRAPKATPAAKAAPAKRTRDDEDEPEGDDDDEEEDEPPKKKAKAKAKPAVKKKAPAAKSKPKKASVDDDEDDEVNEDEEDEEPPKKAKKAPSKPKAKAKPKKKAATPEEEDDDDEEEEEEVPVKAAKAKPAPKAKGKKAKADDDEDKPDVAPPPKNVTVIKRGLAPVDPNSQFVHSHQVYAADGEVYDAMLNQTNVAKNNNKFYVIQLLHPISTASTMILHTRWGRVGENGQSAQKGPWNAATAINEFKKQFKAKSAADWSARKTMVAKAGKYMWLERDFENQEDEEMEDAKPEKGKAREKTPDVQAGAEVQSLMEVIFSSKFIHAHLEEMNYDANKLPLGKLAKSTILNGFTALKALAEVLNDPAGELAASLGGALQAYNQLSNQYYSVIPHSFGRRNPTVINNEVLLKKELEMLDALGNMEIASKVLSSSNTNSLHPVDAHLASLDLSYIEALDHASDEFKTLERYAQETHGSTHSHYKVVVESIFKIERKGEEEKWRTAGFADEGRLDDGDRLLLWHGSRSTNFAGILKQGLRIAPPEAPVTGYMFGKGAYFADHMSKSANYCCSNLSNNIGLLLLAEVAAQPFNELLQAKYDADVECKQNNKLATKGIGRVQPVEWQDCGEALGNQDLRGVHMPKGPGKDVSPPGASLQYNEYIVYDTSQIRLRYLFKVTMK